MNASIETIKEEIHKLNIELMECTTPEGYVKNHCKTLYQNLQAQKEGYKQAILVLQQLCKHEYKVLNAPIPPASGYYEEVCEKCGHLLNYDTSD